MNLNINTTQRTHLIDGTKNQHEHFITPYNSPYRRNETIMYSYHLTPGKEFGTVQSTCDATIFDSFVVKPSVLENFFCAELKLNRTAPE